MQLTRRDLLAAGALGALTACTSTIPPEPIPVDPDLALVAAAVTREQALLTAYDAALADHPGLTSLLAPLRAQHLQHLQRLQPPASPTGAASSLSTASPLSSSPTRTAVPTPLPLDRPVARRRALATLERSTSIAHGGAALTASRQIAPLLASLSASEASHVVVL